MKKLMYVSVALLVVLGGYWLLRKIFRGDNDSPIIIGDTTTGIMTGRLTPETKISRDKVQSNNQHFQTKAGNMHYVHDKEKQPVGSDKDSYRAACLVPQSGGRVDLAKAADWEVSFKDSFGNLVLLLTWPDPSNNPNEKGIINIGPPGWIADANRENLTKANEVDSMQWTINGHAYPLVKTSRGELIRVHYCPDGKCKLEDDSDPCNPPH